jgi:hypothetical protein
MATYRRDELVRAVLEELTVLDANESPEAEDYELINARCQQKLEELNDDGLIPFDLGGDEIPARYFIPLVRLVAEVSFIPYGLINLGPGLAANAESALKTLRRLKQKPYYGAVAQATYF